jgi:hypothetical protein
MVVATPDPATAAPEGFDPYNGQPLSIEKLQRSLDMEKAKTAILEERLKQTALNADLEILPAKKKAEAGQYGMSRAGGVSDAPLASTDDHKVKPKPVTVAAAPAPEPVVLKVTSVIGSGSSAAVMLEANGQTIVAHNGENTPYGVLTFVDSSTLSVGGRRLYLPSKTLARMAVSDPTPAEKGATDLPQASPVFTSTSGTASRAVLPPPIPAPPALPGTVSK